MADEIVTSEQATSKQCSKCGVERPLHMFGWTTARGKKYRKTWCKRCCNDYAKEYKNNPPPKRRRLTKEEYRLKNLQWSRLYGRRNTLKRTYNLTEEEYQIMLDSQGGGCAICGEPETVVNGMSKSQQAQPLSVDHDHTTGQVRALLCSRCNRKVMQIEYGTAHLAYLKKHRSTVIVDLLD